MVNNNNEHQNTESPLATTVGDKATRKIKARRTTQQRVWFGLGMMGLIGWSVTVPTLLGAGLGIYIDEHYPSDKSWTLALLVAGLAIGCFNAWHWLSKENIAIHKEHNEDDNNE